MIEPAPHLNKMLFTLTSLQIIRSNYFVPIQNLSKIASTQSSDLLFIRNVYHFLSSRELNPSTVIMLSEPISYRFIPLDNQMQIEYGIHGTILNESHNHQTKRCGLPTQALERPYAP